MRRRCAACRDREPASACDRCRSTGYSGIAPLAELLTPTDAIQTAIVRGQTSMDIRRAMDAAGFPSIKEHAATLVTAGVTSRDEVARVLGADAMRRAAGLVAVSQVGADRRRRPDHANTGEVAARARWLRGRRSAERSGCGRTGRTAHPSLIVMDLNMPTMDGYEAIAQIRRVHGLESTPIVVVTMEDSAKVADQVLALGADDYIMKPFEPSVLTARVKAAFRRQRLAA